MESNLSCLSSLKDDDTPIYVQPHYRESYRLAIYALLCGGKDAYEEFLRAEQISHFLSEEEIGFILGHAELPAVEDEDEGKHVTQDGGPSTYFPAESDEEVPDLELGWPEVTLEDVDTSISLLFNPPRQNTPSIKDVVRKQIQEARQVVAIAMDVFTDVDIFKEIITAALRGVAVYILLDDSQFKSFLTMSHRVGINIQDLKNIRVRTVPGQQYQCRSGVKFHGGLEQKFILVDCRTVLHGTYSYSWSFEKINLSMVLVITGQLVCSFDEEFRRLYARSTVPPVLSKERPSVRYLRDAVALHSPNSSQLSLHQIPMKPRLMNGMRSAQDDRFSNAMLGRGLSVQERLHLCPDSGNMVRGHSYGGELQKINSMTRLRMGTKDIGLPAERNGPNLRGSDTTLTNRLSQHHIRHQTRYGPDQNLIPFNSETSLHRWKIDTYFNDSNKPLDAQYEALSPMISPYSSHTGLNEHQSQMIHSRSRDIKSRLEEIRQKRLSLQEYANLRQSQESLRYPTLERPKFTSSRGLDVRHSTAELDPYILVKDRTLNKDGDKREQILSDGHRSSSHHDVKMVSERKTAAYDWYEPLTRSTSAADLDTKLNDPSAKHLQPSGLNMQLQRPMESLTGIPEEKEAPNSRVNSSELAVPKELNVETSKSDKVVPKVNSGKSSAAEESQGQDAPKGNHGSSVGKAANSSGSAALKERKKSTSNEAESVPKVVNRSGGTKCSHAEKQQEEPTLQRKNSMRSKVQSTITPDERKAGKKDDKPLQRKPSLRSQTPSGSIQPLMTDSSLGKQSATDQTPKKGQPPSMSRSQNSLSSPSETEKPKSPSPMNRLSPQRSSKRKTNLTVDQEQVLKGTLDNEGTAVHQSRKDNAYSRYEYLLRNENALPGKGIRTGNMHSSEKDRSASLNRRESGYPMYQTQSGADNKLGRFMQRVGNLISKNK